MEKRALSKTRKRTNGIIGGDLLTLRKKIRKGSFGRRPKDKQPAEIQRTRKIVAPNENQVLLEVEFAKDPVPGVN